MNEAHRENLSAFSDGELAFDQVRFMLRRVEHDVELRMAWSSYHVGRDCLRGEFRGLASTDFADRVMAALEAEQVPVAGSHGARRWLRWSAGGAIAASVAAVALMMAQPRSPAGNTAADGASSIAATTASNGAGTATPTRAPEVPRWLAAPAGQFAQRASASSIEGQIGRDTLIPAAYSRHMAPYMSLRGYPARPAANAQTYGRTADGSWVIPMTPAQQKHARLSTPQRAH